MIYEPDVTLTDYGLAVECLVFAWLIARRQATRVALRAWCLVFFSALAAASLAGGTVHGFFADSSTAGHRALWKGTLVAMGAAALAASFVGLQTRLSPRTVRMLAPVPWTGFVAYCAIVFWVRDDYVVAVAAYLPAALLWMAVLVLAYRDTRKPQPLVGVVGLLLTFAAAGVQQGGIALHPEYFDHNALYHAIQAVALFLLYRAASWSVEVSR